MHHSQNPMNRRHTAADILSIC